MSEFPKIDIATQFHRNNAVPLDSTEIFDSFLAANEYATNNGAVYIGQIITVVENNSISTFQITSEKKLDPILTETNTSNKFEKISENFKKIENLITDLSGETSADTYTINNKIAELSGIVDKNIGFIQAISVDLSDDISNIVEFNNKILTLNTHLDELSNLHKEDIDELLSSLEITNESIYDLSVELKDDIEDISKKIDYIYSDLLDDISNIIDLNAKISKLSSNIDNLSSEHNTEISELKLSIDNLSTTTTKNINANTESILKLSDNISATKNELLNEINGNTLLIDDLSAALNDLSDVFSEQNIDLEEKITNLSDKHKDDIDKLLVEIKETSDDLSGKIESLYDFMKIISDDLSDDISNIVEFNNKISNLSDNLDKLSGKHKDDIEELLSSLEETNESIFELSGKHSLEIETLEKYITELSAEADNIESQVINLSTDFISEIAWRSKPTIIIGKDIDPTLSSDNRNSIMIGNKAAAPAGETIAIGSSAKATGYCTIAIGKDANRNIDNKTPENAIAIGHSSRAKNNGAIAIGNTAQTGTTNSSNAIAIGTSTISRGSGSIVIGKDAEIITTSSNSVAIGVSAMISGNNVSDAVQLGTGTNTNHGTLQFRNYPLVDNNGKIFEERIPDQISANINKLSNSVNELSTSTFEAISKNTELISNLSSEIELSINELNKEIYDISSQHEIDFENLLSKTEDLNNEIDSISSEFSNEISGINSSIINIFDELISNTNNINELSDSVSSLNIYIDELSDKFETFENELSDKVPEYETDPVFTKWKDECSSVIIGKDAKIDDSTNGIAIGLSASSNKNSIAIGMNAKASGPNRIVIGMNSVSEYKGIALGIGAASSGENSVAIGSDAKVYRNPNTDKEAGKGSIALGISAIVDGAKNAVQLGSGTNTSDGTLQFREYPVVNTDGQIYKERLSNYVENYVNDKITEIKSTINEQYKLTSDYTAFETWLLKDTIFAYNEEISANNEITTHYGTTLPVKTDIPAGDTQMVLLWTPQETTVPTDIVIDWGDGSPLEKLDDIAATNGVGNGSSIDVPKNIDISSDISAEQEYATVSTLNDAFKEMFPNTENNAGTFKECFNLVKNFNWNNEEASLYVIAHKYKEYDNKKYIIKIYGSDYCAINTGNVYNLKYTKDSPNTRVKSFIYEKGWNTKRLSRCFDYDLPIASNVTSLNGFTGSGNQCLFEVNVPQLYNWKNVTDIAGLFKSKNNLQKVTGSGIENIFANTSKMIAAKGFFHSCPNLKTTNIHLPVFIGSGQSLRDFYEFDNGGAYQSVEFDIINILPKEKFIDKEISVGNLFTNCSNLSCSDYNKLANIFWADNTVEWKNTGSAFKDSGLDLNRIPKSWGGNFDWDNKMYKLHDDLDADSVTMDSLIEYLNDFKSIISCLYDGKFSNENISCLNNNDSDSEDLSAVMTDINTMNSTLSGICLKKYIKIDNLDIENSTLTDVTLAINKFKKILF